MATVEYIVTEVNKKILIQRFQFILSIISNCPEDMLFKIDLQLDAVDRRFGQVAEMISSIQSQTKSSTNLSPEDIQLIQENLKTNFSKKSKDEEKKD